MYHEGEAVQKLRPVWTLSLERHTRMMIPSHSQLAWHSSPCPLQFYHVPLKLYWPTGRAYRAKRGPPQNQESTRPKITEVPKSLCPVDGSCAISEGARRTFNAFCAKPLLLISGPQAPFPSVHFSVIQQLEGCKSHFPGSLACCLVVRFCQ